MKTQTSIPLTNYDCLQILACSQALEMADKHKMYMTHPKVLRAIASQWLTKVNVDHSPKAKWATLRTVFDKTFESVLSEMQKEKEAK